MILFIAGKRGSGRESFAFDLAMRLVMPVLPVHTNVVTGDVSVCHVLTSEDEIMEHPHKEIRVYEDSIQAVFYEDVEEGMNYVCAGDSEMYLNMQSLFHEDIIVPIVLSVNKANRIRRLAGYNMSASVYRIADMDDRKWKDVFDDSPVINGDRCYWDVLDDLIKCAKEEMYVE